MQLETGSLLATQGWDELVLLRVPEVAMILGISRSKVYELISSGELPSITIGGCRRVPVAMLREWLQRQGA
jgi:excisionase family DNA binding protein